MMTRAGAFLIVLGIVGCAMFREPVMYSPHGNWLVFGYGEDRSDAISKAEFSAQGHCEDQHKRVRLLSEVTVYQGALPEETRAIARAAGEAARVYGEPATSQAATAMSSPTDYKTTIEFQCQ